MRKLPLVSAGFFGIAALLYSLIPFFSGAYEVRSFASLAVISALLCGYIAGGHIRRKPHLHSWGYFCLVGVVVAVAAAQLGSAAFSAYVVYDTHESQSLHQTIEILFAFAYWGFWFGVMAMPFGIAAGLAVWAVAKKGAREAV